MQYAEKDLGWLLFSFMGRCQCQLETWLHIGSRLLQLTKRQLLKFKLNEKFNTADGKDLYINKLSVQQFNL